MAAVVERVEQTTANGIRAGTVVSTLSQAVEELLSNSIDAGATSVEIKVDLPSYRLSVADNGRGIPAQMLQSLVATSRATSKATSTEQMRHASTYGFRGEALFSLGQTSLLEIQSRCLDRGAHAKVVRDGQTLHFGPTPAPVRNGTIVTVRDAFYKWPVRRRAINEVTEILNIKVLVARIALVNNSVAMTVIDTAKSKSVLKTASTGSLTRTFTQLFSSDKLSMARKLTFEFQQFRITGYLSPPSSSACHWSKEFQLVYVNKRWIRRLNLLHKTINTAFTPCLALLTGRGGADGQGVVRRIRNPNASSGQRQDLFPVFVLNVECPSDQVDIMAEPDKTWVEFSDWPTAKNACIAMLLAFLPHFDYAVPSTVLRDLRRAFHRNKNDETWALASTPPADPAGRASPEPAASPSPSPMRLSAPDVGMASSLFNCAWMGQDRGSSEMRQEEGQAMAFQDDGVRAEGFLYPSPASRFGARDDNSSRLAAVPFGSFGDEADTVADVASVHFDANRVTQSHCLDREDEGARHRSDDTQSSGSPYFDDMSYSQRLVDRPVVADAGDPSSGYSEGCRNWEATAGGLDDRIDDDVLDAQAQRMTGDLEPEEKTCWVSQKPCARTEGSALPPTSCVDFTLARHHLAEHDRGEDEEDQPEGGVTQWRQGRNRVCPDPDVPVRDILQEQWLRDLPGVTDDMRTLEPGQREDHCVEVPRADNLSRLFDYAFTDNGRGPEPAYLASEEMHSTSDKFIGSSREHSEPRLASGDGHTERPPQQASREKHEVETQKQAAVGVTVRRPPSPCFDFMTQDEGDNGPEPHFRSEHQEDSLAGEAQEEVEAIGIVDDIRGGRDDRERDIAPLQIHSRVDVAERDDATCALPKHAALRSLDFPRRPASGGKTLEASTLSRPRAMKRKRPQGWAAPDAAEEKKIPHSPCRAEEMVPDYQENTNEQCRQSLSHPGSPDVGCGWASRNGYLGRRRDRHRTRQVLKEGNAVNLAREDYTRESPVIAVNGSFLAAGALPGTGRLESHFTFESRKGGDDNSGGREGTADGAVKCARVHDECETPRKTFEVALLNEASSSHIALEREVNGRAAQNNHLEAEPESEMASGSSALHVDALPVGEADDISCISDRSYHRVARDRRRGRVPADVLVPPFAVDPALAYDRDVLGGDGLAIKGGLDAEVKGGSFSTILTTETCDSCQESDPGAGIPPSHHVSLHGQGCEPRGPKEKDVRDAESTMRTKEASIPEVLQAGQDEVGAGAGAVAIAVTPEELGQARVIGQAGRKFILLRARMGTLLCVDQHAADERVKLEALERQMFGADRNRRNIERLLLDPPEKLPITSSDGELLMQHRKILSAWHFEVAVEDAREGHVGAPMATLRAVPMVCGVRMSVQDLMGFLHHLRESVEPGSCARWVRPPQVQHILNYKACHSAIRFGDLLTRIECIDLIRKLAACARPFCCAHGRPSVVPLCVLRGGKPARTAKTTAKIGNGHEEGAVSVR